VAVGKREAVGALGYGGHLAYGVVGYALIRLLRVVPTIIITIVIALLLNSATKSFISFI
jgi:hypothetical protein